MSLEKINRFTLLRRVNLGNYEHYEIEIIIFDEDENKAMERAVDLYQRTVEVLNIREKVNIKRVGKRDWGKVWEEARKGES